MEVIAIDEAQFFPDLLKFCTEASDHANKQVLVAGLDGDFQRQRFGQVSYYRMYSFVGLLALCDHIVAQGTFSDFACMSAGARLDTSFRHCHQADCRLCILWSTCFVFSKNCS